MNKHDFTAWLQQYSCHPPKLITPKPLVMGILNVTPDSFSDGGLYLDAEKACARALEMVEQGADILDIGGESSRPGTHPVSIEEELSRVIPIVEALTKKTDVCISIDTCKPEVMRQSVAAGASMINDISGLMHPEAVDTLAALKVPVCLMHMQGTPASMQKNPVYKDGVLNEVHSFLAERIQVCLDNGIPKSHIIVDPGFGFGKTIEDNLLLLKHLAKWQEFKLPVLLGVSRKSTIGALLNKAVSQRGPGSLAVAVYAMLHGAGIIRTHDVDETAQALTLLHHIENVSCDENGLPRNA